MYPREKKSRLRVWAGWLAGLFIFAVAYTGVSAAIESLGVPTYVEFDTPRFVTYGTGRTSYEQEEYGASTTSGIGVIILSIAFGLWAGYRVYNGKEVSDYDRNEVEKNAGSAALFGGILSVAGCLQFWIFGFSNATFINIMSNVFALLCAGGAFWVARKFYRAKEERGRALRAKDELD